MRKDNTTGVKGVSRTKGGTYHAYVAIDGRRVFSKHFKTLMEAKEAVEKAREQLHKSFTNHG